MPFSLYKTTVYTNFLVNIIEIEAYDQCLLSISEGTVHSTRLVETDAFQEWTTLDSSHYFDTTIPSNVTGLVGDTVELMCKVKNLGNKTVSILVTRAC